MRNAPVYWFVTTFANLQLRSLLILPFILQTVGVVTLVSYLSYRSGSESVEKLADQLMMEVDDRIKQHLDSYLGKAQEINRTNVDAFESGILDLNNFNALGKYFYRQVRSFNFAYINFGSKEGGFIGAGYGPDNKLGIGETLTSDLNNIRAYLVDNQGNRLKLERTIKNPQTNNSAWYVDAAKMGKPIWSSIYTWSELPDRISISASTPVYDNQKKLLGVLGIDLELNQISRFLKKLHYGRSGNIFIVERSGLIVASSRNEPPATIIDGKATRLQALNSRESLIRDVTQDLIQRFGSLQAISAPQSLRPFSSQKPFVRITPYRDNYGLDWLVVTVIPESEFMAEIHNNAYKTFILCGLTLLIAIGTGSFTAYWIAQPIMQLSQASQALAKGEWQESLFENIAIAELKVLATSFNQMSIQIKKAVQESESKFSTIFHTTPDPVCISTLGAGNYLNVNESFCQFWGDTAENIIGKTCTELGMWENLEDFYYFRQTLFSQGSILNFKVRMYTYSRQIKTVLISARVECLDGQDCIIGVMTDVTNLYEELRLRKQVEEALQKSEAMLSEAQQLTHIGNWEYDVITGKITWSTNLFQILGRDQTLGEPTYEENLRLYHPEDAKRLHQLVERALSTGESYQLELRIMNADGSFRYVEGRGKTEINADEQIIRLFGTTQDITERKQAELELRKSRDLREAIYNESTDAIFLVDFPNPLILDCNHCAVEMFEVASKEELIGIEGQNLQKQQFTDDQKAMILDDLARLGVWSQEIEYVTKKGNVFWGNLAEKRIDVAGKTLDLVRVTNISQRKKAELALLQSEKRFQEISASSPGVIYIIVRRLDGSWYYEYMSRAFEDIHELTIDQILENPQQCFDQFHSDDRVGYEKAVASNLETMSCFNYEWRIITPSGKVKWIKARSNPERRENGEIAYYGVVLDVSDRKKAELALREVEYNLRIANQELEKQVNIDGLTQIANRRCFDQSLEQEWQRLYREQQPLSLLLFDVDYFKLYNDTYGHQMGDECLIKIAQSTQQALCRPADLVARYGGEEFVVILPNTKLEGAMAIAQQIHSAIQDLAIPHRASQVSNIVTISLGIASLTPKSELSATDLIDQADQALYNAKQNGRNQSVIF